MASFEDMDLRTTLYMRKSATQRPHKGLVYKRKVLLS